MTPEEIREARQSLGLTARQMGAMLDINDQATYRTYEAHEGASRHRKPAARVVRLLRAYLGGYRPDDWPVKNTGKLPMTKIENIDYGVRMILEDRVRLFFSHGQRVYEYLSHREDTDEFPVVPDHMVGNAQYTTKQVCDKLLHKGVPIRAGDDLITTIRAEWKRARGQLPS